jgi:hypothetical protein
MRIQTFDFSVDLLQSLLWMYDKATNLKTLVTDKQAWFDLNQTEFWQDWIVNVFNLCTADIFGIAVWSRILNVPFYVNRTPETSSVIRFGFGAYRKNFNNGNFAPDNDSLVLTLEEQRFLLRLKYFQLCTNGAVTSVNEFLNYLILTSDIGYSGTLYMLDGLNMSIRYVFTASGFPANLFSALKNLDVLPRPAGVNIKYVVHSEYRFGFGEAHKNFNNGNLVKTIF